MRVKPHQTSDNIQLGNISEHDVIETISFQNPEGMKLWVQQLIKLSIWGLKESLSWMVTPRSQYLNNSLYARNRGSKRLAFVISA